MLQSKFPGLTPPTASTGHFELSAACDGEGGILAIRGELQDDPLEPLIVLKAKLAADVPEGFRVRALALFRQLATFSEKCRLAVEPSSAPDRGDLWALLSVSAKPLGLSRETVLLSEFEKIAKLAHMLQGELPAPQRPPDLHKLYESVAEILEPVLPLTAPGTESLFDSPGELYQRRSLRDGTTYDEPSPIVLALKDAEQTNGACYPVVWLREIGRVHSAAVQGGLLDLMPPQGEVVLPDGCRVRARVCYVADSNYQAETDSTHTLVTFDDALRRRFNVNLTLDYLPPEQESQVVHHLLKERGLRRVDMSLIERVVRLGQAIRRQRQEGSLLTLPAPTIATYVTMMQMAEALPHMSLLQIASDTALGNAGREDRKMAFAVFNEVFGLQPQDEEDPITGRGLF